MNASWNSQTRWVLSARSDKQEQQELWLTSVPDVGTCSNAVVIVDPFKAAMMLQLCYQTQGCLPMHNLPYHDCARARRQPGPQAERGMQVDSLVRMPICSVLILST